MFMSCLDWFSNKNEWSGTAQRPVLVAAADAAVEDPAHRDE